MKKIFLLILLSLISSASFALPNGKPVLCYRHGEFKGGLVSHAITAAERQNACWTEFKIVNKPEMLIKHPGIVATAPASQKTFEDTDPHCFNGEKALGPGDGGNL